MNGTEPITKLVDYLKQVDKNYPPSIATIASAVLSLHFPTLKKHKVKKGIPVPVLLGEPGTNNLKVIAIFLRKVKTLNL